MRAHTTHSAEETHRAGFKLGQTLPDGAIVALYGDLGAGKTTFIRGVAEGIGLVDTRTICSPTFNYLNIYPGDKVIYHFDLYRLKTKEEFYAAGFNEYFEAGGICLIEWAEKLSSELPPKAIQIHFSYLAEEQRLIEISGSIR